MLDIVFRHYDIRGKVGSELMLDEVYNLGRAIASYFIRKNSVLKTVCVGADARVHSPAIKRELCRALQDSGLDVVYIGVCPTPVLYFSLHTLKVDAGIMITASHNTKEYNGFKICLGTASVWGNALQDINSIRKSGRFHNSLTQGQYRTFALIAIYIDFLLEQFPDLVGSSYNFVIDCANGTAGSVIPLLKKAFNWHQCHLLYPEIDGNYPHHEADPTVLANMQDLIAKVKMLDADVGIGLDGDCDRMAPVSAQGTLVGGDVLLSIFASDILPHHKKAGVVYDIKCSSGLAEVITAKGGTAIMSPSGHAIMKNYMSQHQALLGGELSCHFFFKDSYFGYDDGIYAMLRLLRILTKSSKSLEQMLQDFPSRAISSEHRIECQYSLQQQIIQQVDTFFRTDASYSISYLDGIYIKNDKGWILLRGSNTQALLCVRAEGLTESELHRQWDMLSSIIMPLLPAFCAQPC